MLIQEIIQAIHPLQVIGNTDNLQSLDIRHLLTDSRQLGNEPETTLFFAIKTAKNDGAKYIPQLIERGVKAVVVEARSWNPDAKKQSMDPGYQLPDAIIVVENSLTALQQLAAYKRSLYHGPVIGITGSNGKTVVKEWLYQLLKDDYRITRSPKSYNSQIGVPLSVWQLSEQTELAIFEAGISEMGEMARLQPIIRPTIGVITYIGTEHGENFPSLEAKRAEKMQLFANCSTIIEDPTHQNIRTCATVMRALGYNEETITQRILHQTHETILEVNLSALVDNVRYFRSLMSPSTRLTCMVKAFAYGAGSVEVSKALQQSNLADYLAVAVADEGVELRKAGITLPIIIMDPEVAALDLIIENNLQPNIYSFQVLDDIIHAAEAKGLEVLPVHIKIDSGMHRLGFYKEDIPALITRLQEQKAVRVASIFSHLAGSDEAQFDAFTHEQAHYFKDCASLLSPLTCNSHSERPLWHLCNTAGIERFPEYHFDMCRLGIGMYGFSFLSPNSPIASSPYRLKNVCTLKTTILSIKTVPAGSTIGYGRHTTVNEDRQIAVIPIGYADGFDRRFSNYGGEVLVRGKRCPVVGNVCMDQAMIDVTDTDAQPGDYAIVFGDQLPIQELATKLNTIPYEVLTSISRRVQRLYFYE
ncbi:MAG: alanine racemase [Paludibacteraceae bacterium]|nr:alanine racemase [Paludibacteraceae bacterium]